MHFSWTSDHPLNCLTFNLSARPRARSRAASRRPPRATGLTAPQFSTARASSTRWGRLSGRRARRAARRGPHHHDAQPRPPDRGRGWSSARREGPDRRTRGSWPSRARAASGLDARHARLWTEWQRRQVERLGEPSARKLLDVLPEPVTAPASRYVHLHCDGAQLGTVPMTDLPLAAALAPARRALDRPRRLALARLGHRGAAAGSSMPGRRRAGPHPALRRPAPASSSSSPTASCPPSAPGSPGSTSPSSSACRPGGSSASSFLACWATGALPATFALPAGPRRPRRRPRSPSA